MECSSQKALLIIVLMASAIMKIVMFATIWHTDPQRIFHADSESYVRPALALRQIGRFARSPEEPDHPEIVRTPGYPLFIAGGLALFGERYAAVILIQIALSLLAIILVYCLGCVLWNAQIATLCALLLALDLPTAVTAQRLMTETLFTGLILPGILLLLWPSGTLRRTRPQHPVTLTSNAKSTLPGPCSVRVTHAVIQSLAAGLCLGLATLTRPAAYYLPIPVALGAAIIFRITRAMSWKRVLLHSVLLLCPYALLIGGWQYRNYRVTGKAEFSYIQGANFLFYRCAGIVAERDGISADEARDRLGFNRYAEVHPETADWSIAQLDTRWKQEGLALIRQHPRLFLKSQLSGILTMLSGPGEQSLLEYVAGGPTSGGPLRDLFRLSLATYRRTWLTGRQIGAAALVGFSAAHLFLIHLSLLWSLGTMLTTRDRYWTHHLFIWLVIGYFVAVSAGPGAYSRFRIPIMPLLSLYAGHGIAQFIRRVRRHPPHYEPPAT